MIRYHAAWILPIAEPAIRNGWVAVERGRIAAYGSPGPAGRLGFADGAREIDLGEVVVLPGLCNAHTHLELSYLRDEVPPASEFVTWIRGVIAARRTRPDPAGAEILGAVERALDESTACGTAIVGDISNTLVTFGPLSRSALAGVVFYELIRFNAPNPVAVVEQAQQQLEALVPTARVRASLAAHAPYSVAPLLLRAIRRAVDREPFLPCSIHLSESVEEVEFIRSGNGPWRALLEELGAWDPAWVPPGGSPVDFLDAAGFLGSRVIAVHGVQMTESDLGKLAARGTTLVTCPRSNGHTGAGAPPLAEFYASGVRIAVGTDSLASAPDLNVFAELATMRALAPRVPAASLLESATIEGARALGFDADYGTIEPGKQARLLAVTLPSSNIDVEEYLVSGIEPSQIRWVQEN
ncbi:MAG TPA: amidohydrolase family protein [Vicinamibacterales bacterium]|nr:amidohydrolase family protein [Vicinamibacterales bacterium]